jgi:DNA invertase Pin-like site-specific DNA recombinase
MIQTTTKQKVAIYTRVSTDDQSCERQLQDLRAFAERAGYEVVIEITETESGKNDNRAQRAALLKIAQRRQIDAILVSEMSRWGRSTQDLIATLRQLESWKVSLITLSGMTFDLSTPTGALITTVLAAFAQFERDLIVERTKSGLVEAKRQGKKLGRQEGQNPSDKIAPKVMNMIGEGRSYRWIAHELQISPTTVMQIVKRQKRAG